MDDGSFGCVVDGLLLWDVDDMTTHARSADEATIAEVLQGLAINCGSLLLLSSPVQRGSSCAIQRTVDVHLQYLLHGFERAIDERPLLPRDAGVCDEHIESAVELLYDRVNCNLDRFPSRHVDLVSPAYLWKFGLDTLGSH